MGKRCPPDLADNTDGALAAAATFILAVIGVYGIIHQSVVSRTQEIGIRMALGASKASVLRMILAGALGLAAAGTSAATLCHRHESAADASARRPSRERAVRQRAVRA